MFITNFNKNIKYLFNPIKNSISRVVSWAFLRFDLNDVVWFTSLPEHDINSISSYSTPKSKNTNPRNLESKYEAVESIRAENEFRSGN